MSNLPETLLARLTTADCAAAILGDLTELSATRGRLWFWTAYARTLLSQRWHSDSGGHPAMAESASNQHDGHPSTP